MEGRRGKMKEGRKGRRRKKEGERERGEEEGGIKYYLIVVKAHKLQHNQKSTAMKHSTVYT